jgi:N4-gp56 family major capsid protein
MKMKQSVQELADAGTATTTASAGLNSIVTGVVGKVWLDELIAAAKKKMFFEQFAYVATAPKGNKDVAIPLYTSNISFSVTTTEATHRTMTEINNLTTVVFTPSTKKMGVAISKDVVRTSQTDVVRFAREQMVYDAALTIDKAFDTAIKADTTNTQLWGGGRASEGALVAGDVLDTDLIAKANRVLKSNGWYPEPDKPFVLFLPAVSEEALLKDSQFMNASEYGSNEVVMNGEIGRYIGIKVISTEQCSSGTFNSLAGHYVYMIKGKVSYGIVYGEKPTLEFEYKMDDAEYRVYLDMCYQCKVLQGSAIQVMKVLDA